MCEVSDKLKLCTCRTKGVEQLKHYWILKRPTEQFIIVHRDLILPADIGETAHNLDQQTNLKLLNDGNCFDIEFQH